MLRLVIRLVALLFVKIFYKHKSFGLYNIPKAGAVFVPNHVSFLDPIIVGVSCLKKINFLARETLFNRNKLFGILLRYLSVFPVKRGHGNINSLRNVVSMLSKGRRVVIFAEGSRSLDGSFGEVKRGFSLIAKKAKVPIIPVYVHGTYEIWPVNKKYPALKGRTACIYGKPIFLDKEKISDEELSKLLTFRIALLKEWYLKGCIGTTP